MERIRKYTFVKELTMIYKSLIIKMNNMPHICFIKPVIEQREIHYSEKNMDAKDSDN